MLRLRAHLALAGSLLAVLSVTSPARADTARTVAFSLENGLQVLLSEDHRTPLVAVDIAYDVGPKDDPTSRHGMNHVVENLLASPSTRHVGRNVVDKMFQALDVEPYARRIVSRVDRTLMSASAPAHELELMLWLESDRMAFVLDGIDEHALGQARDALETERKFREEREAYGNLPSLVAAALYPTGHPYHDTALGLGSEVESITRADVKSYLERYFVPNNAVLVIAGDFDTAKTTELVKRYFAPIVRGVEPPTHPQVRPVELPREKRLAVESQADRPKLVVTWPTPAFEADGDQALDAVARILFAAPDKGRLPKRLQKEQKLAQSIAVREKSHRLASELEIEVVLEPGASAEAVLKIVDEEMERIRKGAVPKDEVDAVRLDLTRTTAFDDDSILGRAAAIASQHHMNEPEKANITEYVAGYAALTADKIQRAAATFLPADRRLVTVVNFVQTAPRGGRMAGGK